MTLAEIQREIFERISRPRSETSASFLARGDLAPYARMYFDRLCEALEEDFPAVRATHPDWDSACMKYVEMVPPTHPSVRHYGKDFHRVLSPDLADLARLEWARIEAFDAGDATPLDRDTLAKMDRASWISLVMKLVPSARFVETDHDVEAAWLAADRKTPNVPIAKGARTYLVWRRGFVVRHRAIDAAEARALRTLDQGFAAACEAFADSPERIRDSLEQWLVDELVMV